MSTAMLRNDPPFPRTNGVRASGPACARVQVLYNLQVLRAWAALLVVIHHLNKVLQPAGVDQRWLEPGISGVDLFFVISGFVMVHTVSQRPTGPASFLLNRVIRVVPMYWMLTIALSAACILAPSMFATTTVEPATIAKSLFFIPYEAHPGIVNPVLFVGWTLNYEMFFYLVFSLALLIGRDNVVRVVALTLFVLVMLVIVGLVTRPAGVVPAFFTAPILLEFGAGMLLALGWRRELSLSVRWAVPLLVTSTVAMIVLGYWVPPLERALALGIPATMVIVAALLLERQGWRWSERVGQMLGASSYSLYLVHPFVVMGIAKVSNALNVATLAWLLALVSVAGALLAGLVLHVVIERPLTHRVRSLAGHRSMAAEAADPSA